jgi:hypothetical protein
MAHETVLRSMRLFQEQVVPRVAAAASVAAGSGVDRGEGS